MFKGSMTALITPIKDGKIDENSYRSFVDWQINEGTNGLIPCGTTGESPTLNHSEHMRVTELCIEVSDGRVPVIAGTGSNSTSEAVELSKFADKAGANGLLVVTPYYNKPTQEGLYQHYKKINDNVGIPIIIYNIPSRSVIDMSVETMTRLFELKNIVGVKDATGDLNRAELQRKAMGDEFIMLTGEDGNALEFNKKSGTGCISVTANVAAKLCSEMQNASLAKNNAVLQKRSEEINKLLTPLNKALFIESNPSPVKYAASLLKLSPDEVRLPLVKITDPTKSAVKKALEHAFLI